MYIVRYRIESKPEDVIIELICKTEEEMLQLFEDRQNNTTLKDVCTLIRA